MSPKQFIRYDQIRRLDTETSDNGDEDLQKGRYIRATCLATDAIEDLVSIASLSTGSTFQVQKLIISDPTTFPAIGMIIEKTSPTIALVQVSGQVPLTFAGLISGQKYFVGSSSTISATAPVPGIGSTAMVQVVGVAVSDTTFIIEPSFMTVNRVG